MNKTIVGCAEKVDILRLAIAEDRKSTKNSLDWLAREAGIPPTTLASQITKRAMSDAVVRAISDLIPQVAFPSSPTWLDPHAVMVGNKRFGRDEPAAFRQFLGEALGQLPPLVLGLQTVEHRLYEPDLVAFEIESSSQEFKTGVPLPLIFSAVFGLGHLGESIRYRLRNLRIRLVPDAHTGATSALGSGEKVAILTDARIEHLGRSRTGTWMLYGRPTGLRGEYITDETALCELLGARPGATIRAEIAIDTGVQSSIHIVEGDDSSPTINAIFRTLGAGQLPSSSVSGFRVLGVHTLVVVAR